ncbi:hypothetical protein OHA21_16315 [Actinoplanes sp. NBC_00393]|uniref:hypothetical protein n=1 Tax=Actinoplanes sp. NBC_00393 TaxID=2975953 RepID=UPI002E22E4CB
MPVAVATALPAISEEFGLRPVLLAGRALQGVAAAFALPAAFSTAADAAGLVLSPVLVGGVISSTLGPLLMRRFSSRTIVVTALALCTLALTRSPPPTACRGSCPGCRRGSVRR